jgi:hypothetical protein
MFRLLYTASGRVEKRAGFDFFVFYCGSLLWKVHGETTQRSRAVVHLEGYGRRHDGQLFKTATASCHAAPASDTSGPVQLPLGFITQRNKVICSRT